MANSVVAAVPATALPHERVRIVASYVRELIARGDVDATSVFGILSNAACIGGSWAVAEEVLVELAKGADGISGTTDDLIPPMTVQLIKVMVRHGVVRDIVAWATQTVGESTDESAPPPKRCPFSRPFSALAKLFARKNRPAAPETPETPAA